MSLSDLVICELCGATHKSYLDENICSQCLPGAERKLTDHQKSLYDAKINRHEANLVGLKALTGSAKQKSWGEIIRKQFIDNIAKSSIITHEESIAVYVMLTSSIFKSAAYWIEQRNNLMGLELDLVKAVQLKSKANAMHAMGESNSAEYRIIADQYHAIIEKL